MKGKKEREEGAENTSNKFHGLLARKGGNGEALQLEGRTTSRQSFWAILGHFVLRMRAECRPQGQYWIEYLYLLLATPPYY